MSAFREAMSVNNCIARTRRTKRTAARRNAAARQKRASTDLLVLELLLSVEPLEALGPGLGLVGGEGGRDEGLEVHPHVDAALEEDGLLRAQRAIQRVPLLRVRVVLALQRRAALGHRAVVQRQVPRRLPLLPPPARLLVARYLRPPQPRHHVRVRPPVVDHDLVLLRRLQCRRRAASGPDSAERERSTARGPGLQGSERPRPCSGVRCRAVRSPGP
eukprot:2140469-Rhodomonas_salina.2